MRNVPKWRDEAKALLREGHSFVELGKRFGVSESYVRQQVGPNWMAHVINGSGPAQRRALGLSSERSMDEARAFLKNQEPFSEDIVEGLMADRLFTPVKMFNNGQHRSGVVIECHKKEAPDCLRKQEFYLGNGRIPNPNHAANQFRASGWVVGGGPRADVCPKCLEFIKLQRRAANTDKPAEPIEVKEDKVVNIASIKPVQVARPTAPNATLKDIDKATKRLIDMKMDEVYDAGKGGWIDDWDDAKVADDLKCPVEYVALIRTEFHGPDVRPQDYSKEIDGLRRLADEVREAHKLVDIAIERLTEHDTIMNNRLKDFETKQKRWQEDYAAFLRKVGGQ